MGYQRGFLIELPRLSLVQIFSLNELTTLAYLSSLFPPVVRFMGILLMLCLNASTGKIYYDDSKFITLVISASCSNISLDSDSLCLQKKQT